MASKSNPKALAALLLIAAALAVVAVLQYRPSLLPGLSGEGKRPQVGTYKVPRLGSLPEESNRQETPSASRNLFAFGAPPTPTPDRRPTPTPLPPQPTRPIPTPTPTPKGYKGPCPQFTLTYIGWLGPDRLQVAVFRSGDEVIATPVGEVLKDKFIVRKIDRVRQEVTIGCVDYTYCDKAYPLAK
jgi:hypothetical protein